MIDPGLYYNLKAAREIMRKQTNNANFTVEDISLQASDQKEITGSDITELREDYNLKLEEKGKLKVKKIKYHFKNNKER